MRFVHRYCLERNAARKWLFATKVGVQPRHAIEGDG